MSQFPYRTTGDTVVNAVAATVASAPDFVAGCLVCGSAHGYLMEMEYLQRRDGRIRYRVWSDVQGSIHTEERALSFDILGVLERMRAGGLANRTLSADASTRRSLIVLANREGGCWVDAPSPRNGAPRGDGPLDAIFDIVFPA